jgi:dTDP-4-amino-4,6-dideoxygalactose transaminase/nucleoside-diphosphate-sugar epimerase
LHKRNVLITGGAGFLGAALAADCSRRGWDVTCLDVSPSERLPCDDPRIRFVEGDVRDLDLIPRLVENSNVVFHLAAVVGVDEYIRRPADVLDVNIMGTRNVLMSCLRHDKPVLFSSTSEVYGRNSGELCETSNKVFGRLTNTRWAYAISKAACEEYAHSLGNEGLVYTIVRYFNVYGPLMDAPGCGRVISKFLGCIRDGQPLSLVDGGRAVRSFCYVDDAIEATARIGLSLTPEASYFRRAVNIGRSEPITMRNLALLMIRLTGHQAGTVDVSGTSFFGTGFEEIDHRVPDVTFLRQSIGFQATTSLEDGLRKTLAHWGLLAPAGSLPLPSTLEDAIPSILPQVEVGNELQQLLTLVLGSGRLSNDGPVVRRFEREVAGWLGTEDAVAVSSGAMALELATLAMGLGRGAAILPSFTFLSTLAAIKHSGLEPVFCDVDPDTFTLDPADLTRILASRSDVRLIVPVNVYGVPPDLEAIAGMAAKAGATLMYDNAHGFGTEVGGALCSVGPVATTFSFHATKILPIGEGGLVLSPDPAVLAEVRRLRNHGLAANPLESTPGYNAKMTEVHAAIGLHLLQLFPSVLQRRREYFWRLNGFLLRECAGTFLPQRVPAAVLPNGLNLGLACANLPVGGINEVSRRFLAEGVEARRYFHPVLHHLRAFQGGRNLPVTDRLSSSVLVLPVHSRMQSATIERVERAARQVADSCRR